jgi:hypothetical protein
MAAARQRLRAQLGIDDATIVFGIVGSLAWNARVGFCYGWELVNAIRQTPRADVAAIVVGDGAGLDPLRQAAGDDLGRRVFLTGGVPADRVLDSMAAFDVASLPQSVDGVGSFRYTTKISEYVAARLPVVTGQIPMAYDLGGDWTWRLPGSKPWGKRYIASLANLMNTVTRSDVSQRRDAIPSKLDPFDRATQVERVGAMITDILAALEGAR